MQKQHSHSGETYEIRNGQAVRVGGGLGLMTLAGSAFAEVPATVLTAITEAGQDAGTVAAAVLVVVVSLFAFVVIRRAVK